MNLALSLTHPCEHPLTSTITSFRRRPTMPKRVLRPEEVEWIESRRRDADIQQMLTRDARGGQLQACRILAAEYPNVFPDPFPVESDEQLAARCGNKRTAASRWPAETQEEAETRKQKILSVSSTDCPAPSGYLIHHQRIESLFKRKSPNYSRARKAKDGAADDAGPPATPPAHATPAPPVTPAAARLIHSSTAFQQFQMSDDPLKPQMGSHDDRAERMRLYNAELKKAFDKLSAEKLAEYQAKAVKQNAEAKSTEQNEIVRGR